jgi:hypothetical protein
MWLQKYIEQSMSDIPRHLLTSVDNKNHAANRDNQTILRETTVNVVKHEEKI